MNNKQLLENTLSNDAFIQVNKAMIKLVGLEASVLLGDLIGKRKYFENRDELHYGAFFITRDKIQENLGLTPHQQRKAEKQLIKAGMLEIESKSQRVNGKAICKKVNYYTIIDEIILLALNQSINSRTSKSLTSASEDIEDVNIKELNGTETQIKETPNNEIQVKEREVGETMVTTFPPTPNIPIIHKGETKDYNEWTKTQTMGNTLDYWDTKLQQLEQMKVEAGY